MLLVDPEAGTVRELCLAPEKRRGAARAFVSGLALGVAISALLVLIAIAPTGP